MTHSITQIIYSKKAILWDFDGCVCDSEEIHYQAYAQAFRHFNHEVNKNEYFHTFTHLGGGVALEAKNYNLTLPDNEVKKLKAQYYLELLKKGKAVLFPEIFKIIPQLQRSNIKNVIASNSPRHEIELILKQGNASHLFNDIIGLEKGLQKKPAPDIFLKALEKHKLSAKDVIVIEDSERGLLAASAAGCKAIWVKTLINECFESSDAPHLAKLTHKELLSYVDG